MNSVGISSGFVGAEAPVAAPGFTGLEEVYVSASGYTRLFRCRRYNRLHILKALKPGYAGQAFYEQALRKEFDIGYCLEHPHIGRALGWETVPGVGHCIVLEYIDGITLREMMEQGRLTPDLARKFIRELCDALDYLHGRQIIHRDLKPDNILVTHNGANIKLIDFGLSDSDDYDVLKLPAGTRYYLAPEVLKSGQKVDCRADIYSLGIVIGEMAERLNDKRLAAISRKCTRRNPQERYPSALKVGHALKGRTLPVSFKWAAFVVVLLLVSGYAAYRLWSSKSGPVSLPVYGNYSMPVEQWPDSIPTGHPQSF